MFFFLFDVGFFEGLSHKFFHSFLHLVACTKSPWSAVVHLVSSWLTLLVSSSSAALRSFTSFLSDWTS